jgi:septal ring factor EnvC (AmiA/AmiB activator)
MGADGLLPNPALSCILERIMKNRIGVIVLILVLLCVGLGIALIAVKQHAADEQRDFAVKSGALSNDLVLANEKLDQQRQDYAKVVSDRDKGKREFEELTGRYSQLSINLSQASNQLAKTEAALKTSQEETAQRDAKIAGLEAQNQALDKQAVDLSTAITNLTTQISETKRKLATSEGEKGFLEKELKRLMTEKAELEKQFNDLAVVRAQVSKLKEELSVARRLEWIRQGLFTIGDERGAQKLMQGPAASQAKPAPRPKYDLNVEVSADGSVKVIPPLTNPAAATNAPPNNAPPK